MDSLAVANSSWLTTTSRHWLPQTKDSGAFAFGFYVGTTFARTTGLP